MFLFTTDSFKQAIQTFISNHFGPEIEKKFLLIYEAGIYNKNSIHIWRQLKDDRKVLEVRYRNNDGTIEYICDLYPWIDRKKSEHHLLQFITDKFKDGKIGKDWDVDARGGFRINPDILKGTHGTDIQAVLDKEVV